MKNPYLFLFVLMSFTHCISQNFATKIETNAGENQKQIIKTIIDLTTKIDSNKNTLDSELFFQRGMLYIANKEYQNAKVDFYKVIVLNTSRICDSYYWKGLAGVLLGEPNCDDFQRAKDLDYKADWEKLSMFCLLH